MDGYSFDEASLLSMIDRGIRPPSVLGYVSLSFLKANGLITSNSTETCRLTDKGRDKLAEYRREADRL